jgi:predicted NBD/HSP70 family sugar kinase
MLYMGIDLHKRFMFATVINEEGKEVDASRKQHHTPVNKSVLQRY